MPPVGFELKISAGERPQNYARCSYQKEKGRILGTFKTSSVLSEGVEHWIERYFYICGL